MRCGEDPALCELDKSGIGAEEFKLCFMKTCYKTECYQMPCKANLFSIVQKNVLRMTSPTVFKTKEGTIFL